GAANGSAATPPPVAKVSCCTELAGSAPEAAWRQRKSWPSALSMAVHVAQAGSGCGAPPRVKSLPVLSKSNVPVGETVTPAAWFTFDVNTIRFPAFSMLGFLIFPPVVLFTTHVVGV